MFSQPLPSLISRVYAFNSEVVGVPERPLGGLPAPEHEWLVHVLREEAQELGDATELPDMVDALVDSVIFAIGGLYRLGLTPGEAESCFHAVMDANFQKRSGQKSGRVFQGVSDAVKPEGWQDPKLRIAKILGVL